MKKENETEVKNQWFSPQFHILISEEAVTVLSLTSCIIPPSNTKHPGSLSFPPLFCKQIQADAQFN